MITAEEVMDLGERFWELVRTHAPVEEIEPFFLNPFITHIFECIVDALISPCSMSGRINFIIHTI